MAGAKLIRLGPSGWMLLLRAQRALISAQRQVRRTPEGELFDVVLERSSPSEGARPQERARVLALARAVDRMSRFGLTRPLCLARSLALHSLMQSEEIPGAEVQIGVAMKDGEFKAHAWVTWNGEVIGDDPSFVAGFRELRTDSDPARSLPEGWFVTRDQT